LAWPGLLLGLSCIAAPGVFYHGEEQLISRAAADVAIFFFLRLARARLPLVVVLLYCQGFSGSCVLMNNE
jgi:hypothetical protein